MVFNQLNTVQIILSSIINPPRRIVICIKPQLYRLRLFYFTIFDLRLKSPSSSGRSHIALPQMDHYSRLYWRNKIRSIIICYRRIACINYIVTVEVCTSVTRFKICRIIVNQSVIRSINYPILIYVTAVFRKPCWWWSYRCQIISVSRIWSEYEKIICRWKEVKDFIIRTPGFNRITMLYWYILISVYRIHKIKYTFISYRINYRYGRVNSIVRWNRWMQVNFHCVSHI